jgi:penicillin-binding protein 1A
VAIGVVRYTARRTWARGGVEAASIVLDRRRFLALSSLAALSASAPADPAAAWELADAQRLVLDNRERGVRVLGSRGEFVAARGAYYGPPVPFGQLPKHLVDAVVASEDRRFYDHFGLDPLSLARALWSTAAGRTQGGSTLTQQTLKEIYLKRHNAYLRKVFAEPLLAPVLELNLTKEDILYVYLNRVFFGGGAHGVEAASRVYFGKYARELSVLEAAVLVSLLPAPNRFNPHRDPQRALQRAHRVLDQMVEQGRLTGAEAERAKRQRLALAPPRSAWSGFHPGGTQVGWFARWAEQQADAAPNARPGVRTVLTTLDARVQRAAERHLGEALARHGGRLNIEEGAAVVMRPDGAVLAMVGGRDYRSTEWNNATQARRQPGSVAKLFVHLAALERGASASQEVSDAPLSVGGRPVRNFDGRYLGGITMGAAIARSSNTAAVRLAAGDTAGIRSVARRLGITADLSWCEAGDLALGTWEARLIELTAAYAAVANDGFLVTPWTVQEMRGNDGARVSARAQPPRQRVIGARHAAEMRRMLAAVVRDGTGRAADPGFWAAGKTGTTDGHRDAWFVGFTERLVAGVWLGNASSSAPMSGVSGGGLPARIWRAVMIDAAGA